MKRREFLGTFACAGVVLALGDVGQVSTPKKKPNIIHIMADDMAWDDLSCYGCKDIQTPNIDKFAGQGRSFMQFYAPHPTCTPTRAAVLTGRYAARVHNGTGGRGLDVLWPDSDQGLDADYEITIAKLLKGQGYQTGLIGKWHLGCLKKYLPPNQGFDYYVGIPYPNDHGPERWGGTGSKKLDKIAFIRGTEIVKRLSNEELAELPALFEEEAVAFIKDKAKADSPFFLHFSNIETHTPWFVPKGREGKSKIGPYGDAVISFDHTFGQIMAAVKEAGIEDNTLIVLSSDNGPLVVEYPELEACYGKYAKVDPARGKAHRLRDGKYQARYEGGTNVFCIARWPGVIPENSKTNELTTGADLFTTFAVLGGARLPQDRPIDGINLMPIMAGRKGAKGHSAIYEFPSNSKLEGVRKGDWKVVLPNKPNWAEKGVIKEPLLFNLRDDPGEKNNVAKDHPAIVKELVEMGKQAKFAVENDEPIDFH